MRPPLSPLERRGGLGRAVAEDALKAGLRVGVERRIERGRVVKGHGGIEEPIEARIGQTSANRRAPSHRGSRSFGMLETCVARRLSLLRWKSAPSATGLVRAP